MKSIFGGSNDGFNFICEADFTLAPARIYLYNKSKEMIEVAENKLADLSMDFAVKVLKLTNSLKGKYALINQLERSATRKHTKNVDFFDQYCQSKSTGL